MTAFAGFGKTKASRRDVLAGSVAAVGCAAFAGPGAVFAAGGAPQRLTIERRVLEVAGRPASVFGLRRPDGGHGLIVGPDERFLVDVENRCGEATIVHWHGQTPPWEQDGVADAKRPLLQPGEMRRYDFAPRSGTHWMHSHFGLQEQALLAAPLIVRTAADLRADVQEAVILLHDFSFRDPAELLAGLTGGAAGGMDHAAMGHGAMGHGAGGQGAPASPPPAAASVDHAAMGHGAMGHGAGGMDLNDVEYDAYLANDRTLDDPQVVQVEKGGRVRLRIINGAAATAFHIDLGGLQGLAVAVDGNDVRPVAGSRFGLSMGQRLDVLLELPKEGGAFPVLAQREGDRKRTGIVLATPGAAVAKIADKAADVAGPVDLSLEARLSPLTAPPDRPVDDVFALRLTGGMQPYLWTIDDKQFGRHAPSASRLGRRTALDMVNVSHMAHPMHLHGHHFQVTALNGVPLAGAVRDTLLVPAGGSARIVFDADNPGVWPLHCHNLLHMAMGMMTEVLVS